MKENSDQDSFEEHRLITEVCQIIDGSRQRIATTVNVEICMMHWQIGKRTKEDVLYSKRAEYGKQIVKKLAQILSERFGGGWSDL